MCDHHHNKHHNKHHNHTGCCGEHSHHHHHNNECCEGTFGFQRKFLVAEDRIDMLENYKEQLERELQGVERIIKKLKIKSAKCEYKDEEKEKDDD